MLLLDQASLFSDFKAILTYINPRSHIRTRLTKGTNNDPTIISINQYSFAVNALPLFFILLFSQVITLVIRVFGPLSLFKVINGEFSIYKVLLNLVQIISDQLNNILLGIIILHNLFLLLSIIILHNTFNLRKNFIKVKSCVVLSEVINDTFELDTFVFAVNVMIIELISNGT